MCVGGTVEGSPKGVGKGVCPGIIVVDEIYSVLVSCEVEVIEDTAIVSVEGLRTMLVLVEGVEDTAAVDCWGVDGTAGVGRGVEDKPGSEGDEEITSGTIIIESLN